MGERGVDDGANTLCAKHGFDARGRRASEALNDLAHICIFMILATYPIQSVVGIRLYRREGLRYVRANELHIACFA